MNKLILAALLMSSTMASAQAKKMILECTRDKSTQIIRMELVDDSKPTADESETRVTKIQRQISPTDKMLTYATDKQISEEGSIAESDLDIRAVSRLKGSKESCYKMGSELNLDLKTVIGGKGTGSVYIFDVRELPRIQLKDKNNTTCSIPKVMPPKPFTTACKQVAK